MGINWTKSQSEAIEERGKSLLVSAAAGSGKTAVLIERIIRIITEEKIDVDRLLVVTFTNAAAAEMKEKLINALIKARDEGSDDIFFRRQLNLVSSAHISTFHSFALTVIREHFHLIDIDPGVKIADSQDLELTKHETMDELFEEEYIDGRKSFRDFLDAYSSDRNDYELKEQLLEIYGAIMNITDPFTWLSNSVELLADKCWLEKSMTGFLRDKCRKMLENALKYFELACEKVHDYGLEHIYEIHYSDVEKVTELLEIEDFDKLAKAVNSITYTKVSAAKDEKETWGEIKDAVTKLRKKGKDIIGNLKDCYLSLSPEEHAHDVEATYPHAVELERLIRRFDCKYKSRKKTDGVIDFNDVEHYAIEILKDEKVQKEYREKFEYVFVDEYQDSNKLQDTLIELVGRDNNLFLVGDLKQSIYKFRLAEPELFRDRYALYRDGSADFNKKIDLSDNFRSKKPVIDAVNGLFSEIMEGYDESAALKEGSPYTGRHTYQTELMLINLAKNDELSEELLELKTAELEAAAVAKIINEQLIGSEYVDKNGKVQRMRCRDIVILMKSVKSSADIYQQVLAEHGINSYTEVSEGYFDTPEIEAFLSMLKVIDNYRQDVPLLSLMRSPIGGFSIDELIEIRLIDRKAPYYECVDTCAAGASGDRIGEKCRKLKQKIEKFRYMAQGIPIDELLWRLMSQTGFFAYAGALPQGKQRQANLKALVDKARAFQDRSSGGIYEFLRFIDFIKEKKVDTGQASALGENDDVVRIMTIHKSKGLEFPAIIVTGLGKKLFKNNSKKRSINLHKDIGIGLALANHSEMWYKKTLLQRIIEERQKSEELEEQIRVLYVAMTRARDRLILVGAVNDAEKAVEDAESGLFRINSNSFLGYILPYRKTAGISLTEHDRMSLYEQTEEDDRTHAAVEAVLGDGALAEYKEESNAELRKEITERLSFVYPFEDDCKMKSKYSVSELNKKSGGEDIVQLPHLAIPSFAESEHVMNAAEKGTVMHLVMEHIDFARMFIEKAKGAGLEYAAECIDGLVEKELLKKEEAEIIDLEDILSFFDTDIGKRAALAARDGKLHKEREFNMTRSINGTDVMVQGIIDCCFEEDGEYVLVDYKTNYINPKKIDDELVRMRDTYSGQIALYRDAIESILEKRVSESYLYLFSINREVNL